MKDPETLLREYNDTERAPDGDAISTRHSFDIDEKIRGLTYKGRFVCEVPSIGATIQIGRLKASYLPQGAGDDTMAAMLNEMICYLAVVLVEKPKWWRPLDFHDAKLIAKVYEEARSHERRFLGYGENEEGSESSPETGHTPGVDGSDHVGGSVRAPAERSETIISHSR